MIARIFLAAQAVFAWAAVAVMGNSSPPTMIDCVGLDARTCEAVSAGIASVPLSALIATWVIFDAVFVAAAVRSL